MNIEFNFDNIYTIIKYKINCFFFLLLPLIDIKVFFN